MRLSRQGWKEVVNAIDSQCRKQSDAILGGARKAIAGAIEQAGSSKDVEIDRDVEKFAEVWWRLDRKPREFDVAITACLFDLHGGW